MTSRSDHFFHGTRHDIKHLVRPSMDTDLDNYDYGRGMLPLAHRSHTFAAQDESMAWDWARGPGRPRVHTVEPANPSAGVEGDPNVEGAVMHRGAMRIKDTQWIPPIEHAAVFSREQNWAYNGPGHHQFREGPHGQEDRSEHVQGTLPPLNWNQHHVDSTSVSLGQDRIGPLVEAHAHVKRLEDRFNPEPEWHGDTPDPDQESLFPRSRYRV